MHNSKAMGSLANKLLNYVSTTLIRDSNYDIALTLIQNYGNLKRKSIAEIADMCYVSQASISRFCRFLGFEGFREFMQCLEADFSVTADYSRNFRAMLCRDERLAISAYRDELIENVYTTLDDRNIELIGDLTHVIHNSSKVAFYSHHFLWDIGRFLQSKMILMGKYVEQFMSYEAQLASASQLDETSLAIICSVGGSYMSRYPQIWNKIRQSKCKLLVITQSVSNAELNSADYILRCGVTNRDDVGKYGALMAIDYLVMSYMKNYAFPGKNI